MNEQCYNCKYFGFVYIQGKHGERAVPYCHKLRANVSGIKFSCDSYQSREVTKTYGMVKEDEDKA